MLLSHSGSSHSQPAILDGATISAQRQLRCKDNILFINCK